MLSSLDDQLHVIDVVLVFLLLTLIKFHTLFYCLFVDIEQVNVS